MISEVSFQKGACPLNDDKVHMERNTVQETLVIPLYARVLCTRAYPNLFRDERAAELMARLDYDFGALEHKSNGMMYRFALYF